MKKVLIALFILAMTGTVSFAEGCSTSAEGTAAAPAATEETAAPAEAVAPAAEEAPAPAVEEAPAPVAE